MLHGGRYRELVPGHKSLEDKNCKILHLVPLAVLTESAPGRGGGSCAGQEVVPGAGPVSSGVTDVLWG